MRFLVSALWCFLLTPYLSAQSILNDLIPVNASTHIAIQSGDWFDAVTWDTGTVPSDAAIVHIPLGIAVSYEGQSNAHIFAIRVDGQFTCTQTNSMDTTKLTVDTFVGTHMSLVQFHANALTHGHLEVAISPFDIEAHKAGTSGYPQAWNTDAMNHFSDGATTYEVSYEITGDRRFKNYADALAGATSMAEVSRTVIDDGIGVLGRYDWDSTQVSLGMTTMGEIEIIGREKLVMAKLSADAPKNQTVIELESIPEGWKVGDKIVITRGGNITTTSNGNETAMISSIIGNTLTVSQNLANNHEGRPAEDLHCYVGNLNRNITFYSTHTSTVHHRGHFMAMHNPTNIQVKNAAFIDMGRTDKSRLLDDLLWNQWVEPVVHQSYVSPLGQECAQLVSNPKEDISNHRGRYSIHLHRAGAANGTNMAQITGNVVWGNPGWGITHHDSHANVSNNVVYQVTGSGIVSEAGNETGFWDNNLLVEIYAGHGTDRYDAATFFDDYLYSGQGLGMKGRAVVCRGNVIVEAVEGVGIMNMNAAINNTLRVDAEALVAVRPVGLNVNQFPLDINGYSSEGDGIIPQEIPLIMENTTTIWCNLGMRSIERDPGVNHESRSIFDGFKIWGANWGLRINYQADYSFKNVFISGKNANSEGIIMYKHAHNMSFDQIKMSDLGYGIVASKLHNAGTSGNVRTRNTGFTPWVFVDLKMENVTHHYEVTYQDVSNVPFTEHPDNPIYFTSDELFRTRPITFTLNDSSDLEVDLGSGDLEFRIDGAITDIGGTYEFGIAQAASMDNLRIDYEERIYEFASQVKLEEYLANNGIYKDTTNNDQLYFIIEEYVPDRFTFEYAPFPIRVNILNAPMTGIYTTAQIEAPANFEPQLQLISRNGTASQSSTSLSKSYLGTSINPHAAKAIDGNNNGRPHVFYYQMGLLPIGSSAVTKVELEPWWDLDLGENKIIEHIDIWNTVDMQGQAVEKPSSHFKKIYVLVSDTDFGNMNLSDARANATFEYFYNEAPKRFLALSDLNITGRYIRIQAEGYNKIGIAEVDVIGRAFSSLPDCHGDMNGLAYIDKCGTCVKGNTGLAPCALDCAYEWGGTAYVDNCGNCVGGNTGEMTATEIPCNGIDDDCDPFTLDADPLVDADGDGVCDSMDNCDGLEPNLPCDEGILCISDYTVSNDCNCIKTSNYLYPDSLANLALGKTATQSSIKDGLDASRAVDGDTNGDLTLGSVTYTNFDQNAWWEVDLGAVENIGIMNIYNRTDCCKNRLSNFYVFVSDVPFVSTTLGDVLNQTGVTPYFFTEHPNTSISLAVNQTGRYVRVQLNGQHFLSLAEVEIYELCSCVSDTDGDGICDVNDQCEGSDDALDGDNDGIPDDCDTCDDNTVGSICDDGSPCTYNDTVQSDCTCVGTPHYFANENIHNSSFETGDFSDWSRQINWMDNPTNISIETTNVYCAGNNAVVYNGGADYEQLYTDLTNLEIGTGYTLYFYIAGGTADCYIGPLYDVFNANFFIVAGDGSTNYIQQSLSFIATENTMRLWLDLYPSNTIYLDAFSFENNSCATCTDGILNGDETSVDCGGSSCAPCVIGCTDPTAHNYDPSAEEDFCACETCDDGVLNGDEAAIDCGGTNCLPCIHTIKAELLLEGAYLGGGLMHTTLLDNALLPTAQPFNRSPWFYAGAESVNVFPANVTDWILLEMRDVNAPNVALESRAAFVRNDGTIIDLDGTEGVKFYTLYRSTDYYLIARSRHHLAIVNEYPITLPQTTAYNFTDATNIQGAAQSKDMGGGFSVLIVGDFNSDGILSVADFNAYQQNASLLNQYVDEDSNLDGSVTVTDFNLYLPNSSVIGVGLVRY